MFRSKGKLSHGIRNKSSSLLTLNEIEARDKSLDWRKNYVIKPKEIGRGHFSKVYHVSCDNRGKSFAAKVIRRRKGGIDRLEKIKQEAALIRRLNEIGVKSVIQLYETYENFSEVVLITELAKGGSLFKIVADSDSGLKPDYVRIVTYKLLLALESMHQENIVHLDIKADNILLREPYPSTDIALCDFGLATQLREGKSHKELVGTPDYMAPEVINYEKVSVNADMWSVGVVVYYLLTGLSPFMGKSKDETLVNVSKVKIIFDEMFSDSKYLEAKDFILSLCVKCPELRLSSTSAQNHSWFLNMENINSEPPKELHDTTKHNPETASDISEDEDDLKTSSITQLSRCQRWQSVDLNTLNMSYTNDPHKFRKPPFFTATSCENIFINTDSCEHQNSLPIITNNNNRNVFDKLMNVEEVNDESLNDSCSYNHTFSPNIPCHDSLDNIFINGDKNLLVSNIENSGMQVNNEIENSCLETKNEVGISLSFPTEEVDVPPLLVEEEQDFYVQEKRYGGRFSKDPCKPYIYNYIEILKNHRCDEDISLVTTSSISDVHSSEIFPKKDVAKDISTDEDNKSFIIVDELSVNQTKAAVSQCDADDYPNNSWFVLNLSNLCTLC